MSQVLIQQYLNQLQDLRKVSGTHRESVVRVEPLTQKKIGEIAELSLILPMYVPDQLFRAFQMVQQKGTKLDSTFDNEREKVLTEFYLALGDLLLEVRKDLGYKRTSLKGTDIIRNIVHDIDDYAKKYGLWVTKS